MTYMNGKRLNRIYKIGASVFVEKLLNRCEVVLDNRYNFIWIILDNPYSWNYLKEI